eukprot:513833-Amphidinium_carterae.1
MQNHVNFVIHLVIILVGTRFCGHGFCSFRSQSHLHRRTVLGFSAHFVPQWAWAGPPLPADQAGPVPGPFFFVSEAPAGFGGRPAWRQPPEL